MSIGVGILGFAHGHVSTYCERWLADGAPLELVAGYDHDADRLAKAAERFGIEAVDDADKLLADGRIEAVVIGAETAYHADLCERAAAAGKTIVLQKPMSLSLDEARRIEKAVADSGVRFTLAWQMRVDPVNHRIKQLIEDGALGRVYMVRRRHGLSTQKFAGFEQMWHVSRELNHGMWADDAAHAMDFLLWLLGEPASVFAEIDTLRSPTVPDDHGIAVFRYDDGTFAEVSSSFVMTAGETTTEIIGEAGTLVHNFGDGPSCNGPKPEGSVALKWWSESEKRWNIDPAPAPDSHRERILGLAPPLAEFLTGKRGPICTAAEGLSSMRMMIGSYQSAEAGRRVRLAEL